MSHELEARLERAEKKQHEDGELLAVMTDAIEALALIAKAQNRQRNALTPKCVEKLTYIVGGPADSTWRDCVPNLLATETTTDHDEALYADYALVNLKGATWDDGARARAALMVGIPVFAFGGGSRAFWWVEACQVYESLQAAVDAINAAAGEPVEQGKEGA